MTILTAEIGMNHDGHWDRAYELIRQASLAGADIAKFQFGWRHEKGEINHVTPEIAGRLADWCDFWDIEFMASIIRPEALELALSAGVRRFKIASRTVIEYPDLVQTILQEGAETFISLGWWEEEGWPFDEPSEQIRYIFCISEYPTYPKSMELFPERFSQDGYYGYSDHTHGIDACLFALSRGASFIEKHFTLDKTHQSVHNDHILSATPSEFEVLNRHGRTLKRIHDSTVGAGVTGMPS